VRFHLRRRCPQLQPAAGIAVSGRKTVLMRWAPRAGLGQSHWTRSPRVVPKLHTSGPDGSCSTRGQTAPRFFVDYAQPPNALQHRACRALRPHVLAVWFVCSGRAGSRDVGQATLDGGRVVSLERGLWAFVTDDNPRRRRPPPRSARPSWRQSRKPPKWLTGPRQSLARVDALWAPRRTCCDCRQKATRAAQTVATRS